MQPRKETLYQSGNPESQVNLPKESYQMTLSLSKHFSKTENSSKHNNYSSPCCLEQNTYQIVVKLVTRYLYTLNFKHSESCCNPITFNTAANTC
jgi:hypothetical protein